MEGTRLALRSAVFATAGALLVLTVLSMRAPGAASYTALTSQDGSAFVVPDAPGVFDASWGGEPVKVFVVRGDELEAVDALRGAGSATPSIAVPGHEGLRMFALSGRSTHLGCTLGWNASLGASLDIEDYDGDGLPDGRLIDKCHQGQWDAFHRATPVPTTPAPTRLAQLDIRLDAARANLEASHFDGPVGAQRSANQET